MMDKKEPKYVPLAENHLQENSKMAENGNIFILPNSRKFPSAPAKASKFFGLLILSSFTMLFLVWYWIQTKGMIRLRDSELELLKEMIKKKDAEIERLMRPSDIPQSNCHESKNTGSCDMEIKRWYFDSASGNCHEFLYSGCKGNGNNYETYHDCMSRCSSKIDRIDPPAHDPCSLPMEIGPCRSLIPKYYYDSKSKRCNRFFYGGCSGNANNFESEADCLGKCGKNVCNEPRDAGKCEEDESDSKREMTRWYYDGRQCQTFEWSGCGGNSNNFATEAKCRNFCQQTSLGSCQLPSDRGRCRAMMLRYFYDAKTKECVQFVYGGCGGNDNNFVSIEECKRVCHTYENLD